MNTNISPNSTLNDILIDALAEAIDNVGDEVYELSRNSKPVMATKTLIIAGLVGIVLIGGVVAVLGKR